MTDGNIDTVMANSLSTVQKLDTLVWIARVLAAEIRQLKDEVKHLRRDVDRLDAWKNESHNRGA